MSATTVGPFSGTRLRGKRLDLELTLDELGGLLGEYGHRTRSKDTIANWEAGRSEPRANDLRALARALDCELADLYGRGDSENND